jgi:hypothetical protein
MNGRMYILILMGVLALGLVSCGGGGGGGVGTISSTSGGTFSPVISNVNSDVVATWSGTPCSSTPTVIADSVDVKFTAFSAPAGSTGNTPEQVVIDKVSIIYSPVPGSSSPTITTPPQFISQQVVLGGTLTFPVEIAPLTLKTTSPVNTLICSSNIFRYSVTLVFNCHYLVSGDTFSGSTGVNIKFADFGN